MVARLQHVDAPCNLDHFTLGGSELLASFNLADGSAVCRSVVKFANWHGGFLSVGGDCCGDKQDGQIKKTNKYLQ